MPISQTRRLSLKETRAFLEVPGAGTQPSHGPPPCLYPKATAHPRGHPVRPLFLPGSRWSSGPLATRRGSSGSKAGLAIGTAPSSFHPARSMAASPAQGSQSVSSGSDAPRRQELVARGRGLLPGSCLSTLRGGGGRVGGGKHHFFSLPPFLPAFHSALSRHS